MSTNDYSQTQRDRIYYIIKLSILQFIKKYFMMQIILILIFIIPRCNLQGVNKFEDHREVVEVCQDGYFTSPSG